ncbi:MAG TPA: hypothetical protein VFU60_15140 [Ktedonobacterales bacterium]|nr:hypothetical protein [Ktedonobacterales bacterium]
MRRALCSAALLLTLVVALVGCGEGPKPDMTVTMTQSAFAQNIITLKAGDLLAITDPAKGGARQVLYFGNVGQYIGNRNGPSELNTAKGVEFTPGTTRTFTFAKAGVYEVTSALSPKMNLLITVK